MAVVTLQTPIGISNPEARKRIVRDAVCELDEWCALLKLAADSAATADAEEELVTSLYMIQGKIKRRIDTLVALT